MPIAKINKITCSDLSDLLIGSQIYLYTKQVAGILTTSSVNWNI